jgi:hypothetical protein
MSEPTNRIGIVTVSLGLLAQWMHLPAGTFINDVRSKEKGVTGEFEILVEGPAVPETPLLSPTPHLHCTVTVTAPKVELKLKDS